MNGGCAHLDRIHDVPPSSFRHPVIRSYESGEDWYWCYLDQSVFEVQGAAPAPSHPRGIGPY
jgi:hypothetical protein